MSNITQHFVIDGQYLGSVPRSMIYVHAERRVPPSYAFFCPVCGELWAQCPVYITGSKTPERFVVWTTPCKNHYRDNLSVPGSIILSWDHDFAVDLPLDVVKREVICYTNHFK